LHLFYIEHQKGICYHNVNNTIQAKLKYNQKDIRKGILNQRVYICLFNYIGIDMTLHILE